jgi:hypothetical protein
MRSKHWALLLLSLACGCGKREADLPTYPDPAFARELFLSPSSDWKRATINDVETLLGPSADGFRANVVLVEEADDSNLEEFVDKSLRRMEVAFPDFQLLDRGVFKTDSGIDGIRVSYQSTANKKQLWHVAYFFGVTAKNLKHVFTCTAAATNQKNIGPEFDVLIRTYRP